MTTITASSITDDQLDKLRTDLAAARRRVLALELEIAELRHAVAPVVELAEAAARDLAPVLAYIEVTGRG